MRFWTDEDAAMPKSCLKCVDKESLQATQIKAAFGAMIATEKICHNFRRNLAQNDGVMKTKVALKKQSKFKTFQIFFSVHERSVLQVHFIVYFFSSFNFVLHLAEEIVSVLQPATLMFLVSVSPLSSTSFLVTLSAKTH